MANNNKKVTVQEVLDTLEANGSVTIANLAENFKVTRETIRSRLREARKDGAALIHDSNGIQSVDKNSLNDSTVAEAMRSFTNWMLSCVKGQIIIANPVKPLLPAMRRTLKNDMSMDERRQLAKACITVKALLDWVEAEEELQS